MDLKLRQRWYVQYRESKGNTCNTKTGEPSSSSVTLHSTRSQRTQVPRRSYYNGDYYSSIIFPLPIRCQDVQLIELVLFVIQWLGDEDGSHLGLHVKNTSHIAWCNLVAQLGISTWRIRAVNENKENFLLWPELILKRNKKESIDLHWHWYKGYWTEG